MDDPFQPAPKDQAHGPTVQGDGTSTAVSVCERDRDPSRPPPFNIFEVLSFVIISTAIGKLSWYLIVATLLRSWLLELLESHNDDTDQRAANKRALLEEAQKRRSNEVAIVTAAITKNVIGNILQVADQEKRKLKAMRVEAERRRSRDVATISSNILDQLLKMQAEESKKEGSPKLALTQSPDFLQTKEEEMVQTCQQKVAEPKHESHVHAKASAFAVLANKSFETTIPISLPSEFAEYDPLSPSFTCIGTTQKNARCRQWMISGSSKQAAADRLKLMRSQDPGNSFELAQLKELADWMLCPRWHLDKKPQGAEIARRWYRQLEPARAALLAKRPIAKGVMTTPQQPLLRFSDVETPSGSRASSAMSLFNFGSLSSQSGTPLSSPPSSIFGSSAFKPTPNPEIPNWNSADRTWNVARNLTPAFEALS